MLFGWSWAMALSSMVAGIVVGALMARINPYVLGPIVAWIALLLPWFIAAETWRWILLVLCVSPLPVIALGLFLGKRWV